MYHYIGYISSLASIHTIISSNVRAIPCKHSDVHGKFHTGSQVLGKSWGICLGACVTYNDSYIGIGATNVQCGTCDNASADAEIAAMYSQS